MDLYGNRMAGLPNVKPLSRLIGCGRERSCDSLPVLVVVGSHGKEALRPPQPARTDDRWEKNLSCLLFAAYI